MKTVNLFEVGDFVEMLSESYEDGNLKKGDKGEVIDVHNHKFGQDIYVKWENAPTSWVDAEDCIIWR